MKVQYIENTCDLEGWDCGEQAVILYNNKVIYAHDHSDEYLDIRESISANKAIQKSLKTKEDIEFEEIDNVSPETIIKIKDFLNF